MGEVIYRDGDQPEPVTSEHPLQGLETEVLRVWKQTPAVSKAHQQHPVRVESAVRRAVFDALAQELKYRAQGMTQEEAQELTRPAMWLAPAFPTT